MALKEYEWRGSTWQFEEGKAPKDAKPKAQTKAKTVQNKAKQPSNKAKAADNKAEDKAKTAEKAAE